MRRYQSILPWSILLASIGGAQAKLNLNSTANVVVYWGQNSFDGKGDQEQQPLSHYCDNDDIDVIPMAFNMMVNGPGGAPQIDFAVSSKDCDVFEGTKLKNCPKIGKDIAACQKKHKTILLSIGGATYNEGGFTSEQDARDGANLMWETFGPKKADSKALRPFGDTALDGFDFDFETNVRHMAPFANELRRLMDADKSNQTFYLTAAPQCPYPDQADKDILHGPVHIDAIWVQFYNNFCGVNNFNTDPASSQYNFDLWDSWAKTVSNNTDVKVLVGVPAYKTAAGTGYISASELDKVIEYSRKFNSFGGVMMWDATQAYGNEGFIKDIRKSLGPAADDSGSSPDPASTSAPASTSTDSTKTNSNTTTSTNTSPNTNPNASPNTSTNTQHQTETATQTQTSTKTKTQQSSNAPDSSLSSSSSSSASVLHKEPEPIANTAANKPTTTTAATKPSTTEAKPTSSATTAGIKGYTTTVAPTETSTHTDDSSDDDSDNDVLTSILGNDLLGLVSGLRDANKIAGGLTHKLTHNLRHIQRSRV